MSEPSQTPAGAVRVQARQEMKRAILAAGRQRLASDGPERLSLRAVARDVGMVSSAVYRYVPSRDALLTELIIESYDALGEAAEQAEASCPREDLGGRWQAIGRGARTWAIAHPHEWALVFGSQIPGYAAPPDTVRAASRIPVLLVALLRDCAAAGVPLPDAALPRDVEAAMAPVQEFFEGAVPAETALRGLMAWTYLVGSVSFQVFGQRTNVISPDGAAAFFDAELERIAAFVGFA
ncbi:TetR/AcrR family transcriptional regulator [Nocardioides mesophilus]|uniref:TetR/AcrR family transcriptional regulator n=1 Tax=Nocardioides mesophilus TaxID=433659 RepID=A0A7G9RD69_9ACTN|nr:TetR/AcrR family transcriptional regulator [Nocardioides mesophilus]QNN53544.1 TetR/AcrR family transcriptional regulator [Nocardioides mesophilus]